MQPSPSPSASSSITRGRSTSIGPFPNFSHPHVPITSIQSIHHPRFFSSLYLPFDLYSTPPISTVLNFLEQHLNPPHSKKPFRKDKQSSFRDLLTPGKHSLSSPLLNDTPASLNSIAKSLFQEIRTYIDTGSGEAIAQILRLVDSNLTSLTFECAVQLLTESNSSDFNDDSRDFVLRAWDLFLVFSERYEFSGEQRIFLLSYFLCATSPEVNPSIQQAATLCILRVHPRSGDRKIRDVPDPIFPYVVSCTSPKHLFGVSIAEALYKEELVYGRDNSGVTVPRFLKKLCHRLFECGGHRTEGTIRRGSSKKEEENIVIRLNNGHWDLNLDDPIMIAVLMKRWVRQTYDPLLPTSVILRLTGNEASNVYLAIVEDLPNPRRDTLKYMIGFIKHFGKFEAATKMNVSSLLICMSPLFSRLPPPTTLEDTKAANALERFIKCLVEDWDTSEVYKPKEMAVEEGEFKSKSGI
jgi:hypothetical protein